MHKNIDSPTPFPPPSTLANPYNSLNAAIYTYRNYNIATTNERCETEYLRNALEIDRTKLEIHCTLTTQKKKKLLPNNQHLKSSSPHQSSANTHKVPGFHRNRATNLQIGRKNRYETTRKPATRGSENASQTYPTVTLRLVFVGAMGERERDRGSKPVGSLTSYELDRGCEG